MSEVTLSRDQIDQIVVKLKKYFNNELDKEIGGFEAEFLISFIGKELGVYYYNKGVSDAHSLFIERSEEINYLFQELEKPID